ncbi:hypothetical protein PATSB16_17550 [Pandoraea thiooxydans]|nr:hypothetical protein PATSB16_17550 [Pandoraea thiooxydans]
MCRWITPPHADTSNLRSARSAIPVCREGRNAVAGVAHAGLAAGQRA